MWRPKYRFRILTGIVKDLVEHDVRMLCEWKDCDVEELNVQPDHIHLLVSIPSRASVSELIGTLKGKLAIKLFKSYLQLKQDPYWGNHFWFRVFCQHCWSERRYDSTLSAVSGRSRQKRRDLKSKLYVV